MSLRGVVCAVAGCRTYSSRRLTIQIEDRPAEDVALCPRHIAQLDALFDRDEP